MFVEGYRQKVSVFKQKPVAANKQAGFETRRAK